MEHLGLGTGGRLVSDIIAQGKWIDFSEFMEGKNLPGTWDQLKS